MAADPADPRVVTDVDRAERTVHVASARAQIRHLPEFGARAAAGIGIAEEAVVVNGRGRGHDGDRAEFDRIVAGLRRMDHPGATPRRGAAVATGRPRVHNGAFAAISLAVIIPMSVVTGGWLGIAAVVVSTVVAGWLLIEPQ